MFHLWRRNGLPFDDSSSMTLCCRTRARLILSQSTLLLLVLISSCSFGGSCLLRCSLLVLACGKISLFKILDIFQGGATDSHADLISPIY